MALMQRDLERPFWLTRNQIWAFVVGSLATAALSFVGGMKFQERLSLDDDLEIDEPTRLIVQEVEDDTLVALLARVEASVDVQNEDGRPKHGTSIADTHYYSRNY